MTTYFSRHAQGLDIDYDTRKRLWDERRIAVHFPDDKRGKQDDDSQSINPEDYRGSGYRAMRALVQLAAEGGYVCAQHHGYEQVQLGRVDPGSKVELLYGKWGEVYGRKGRVAILKTLRLQQVRMIDPADAVVILVGRPRQGTLMRWPHAEELVVDLVEGREREITLSTLLPAQQEILCSEFLRSQDVERFGLPCLAHLILPAGRTMKDLDLVGLATDGKRLFAQVTFAPLQHAQWKMDRLKKYRSEERPYLVLFCGVDTCTVIDDIIVFPISTAFQAFTSTPRGKLWLEYAGGKRSLRKIVEGAGAA